MAPRDGGMTPDPDLATGQPLGELRSQFLRCAIPVGADVIVSADVIVYHMMMSAYLIYCLSYLIYCL